MQWPRHDLKLTKNNTEAKRVVIKMVRTMSTGMVDDEFDTKKKSLIQ